MQFSTFAELERAGLLPAFDFEEDNHDPSSAVTHGMQVHAHRERITNTLGWLYTSAVRPLVLESEHRRESITGQPEEVLRTTFQKPALLPTTVLSKLQVWEENNGLLYFGRPWKAVNFDRITGGVYPASIEGRQFVVADDGHVLSVIGVPGYEGVKLDPLLGTGKRFRWTSPDVPKHSYTTKFFYASAQEDRTLFWRVAERRVKDFREHVGPRWLKGKQTAKLTEVTWFPGYELLQWEPAHPEGRTTDCRVEFHWRLASSPKIVEDEEMAALPDLLDELEDMLEVRTLDVETGQVVKIGSARDVELSPDLPLELNPSGAHVPIQPSLDPYDVHMYKTQEKRTTREMTEPTLQLTSYGLHHGKQWHPKLAIRDVKIYPAEGEYPEIDASEETVPHRGGLFTSTDTYDPDFTPAYEYYVADEDVSDKVTVNITKVTLQWPNNIAVLGYNRKTDRRRNNPLKFFYYWRNKDAGVSWSSFHDAISWLVAHGQATFVRYKTDPRLAKAQVKPKGWKMGDWDLPKWAIDQKLYIDWESEGMKTKARIYGVPSFHPRCHKLMAGKPLVVYQVGYVTWKDEVVLGQLARKPAPLHTKWVELKIQLGRALQFLHAVNGVSQIRTAEDWIAQEVGLDTTKDGVDWGWSNLFLEVANELPMRMLKHKRSYRPNASTKKGCAKGAPSNITTSAPFKVHEFDWSTVGKRITQFLGGKED